MKLKRICFFSLLFVLFPPLLTQAAAQPGPRQVVANLTADLNSTKSLTTLLPYVDWQSALANLSPEERAARGVESAEDLREHYLEQFTSPRQFADAQFSREVALLPPEEQLEAESKRASVTANIVNQLSEQKKTLAQTTYAVGNESVSGQEATVGIVVTIGEKRSNRSLSLIQASGSWLLQDIPLRILLGP